MPSTCYLYFSNKDINVMSRMASNTQNGTPETRRVHNRNLYDVAYYCSNNVECRRVQVLRYFGERFDADKCSLNGNSVCDNCVQGVSVFLVD